LKAFEDPRMLQETTPVLYCGARAVTMARKLLDGNSQLPINGIADAKEALPKKLNVVHAWDEEAPIVPGSSSGPVAAFAMKSLEAAVQDLGAGKVDVLVTAPIDKHAME